MKQLILSIILVTVFCNSKALTLEDAIKQKLVTAQVIGNDATSNERYLSSHSGQCMHLILKNVSKQYLDLVVETGQTFMPEDSNMQPMLVTKKQGFQIYANNSKDGYIYAMCFNAGKGSPGTKSIYKVGKKATGALLQVAEYVEKNNLQGWEGQGMVWDAVAQNCFDCLFNKPRPKASSNSTTVVRWDSARVYRDREVAGGEYHQLSPDSVAKIFKNWYTKVDVKLTYILHEPSKISVQLVDENGKIIRDVYNNVQQEAGKYDVHEALVIDSEWKLKTCKLYLYVNGKIKLDREVHINPANNVGF